VTGGRKRRDSGIGLQDSGRRGVVHINPTPLWAIALHELRLTPIEKVRYQMYKSVVVSIFISGF
jgi:hypothetical protein